MNERRLPTSQEAKKKKKKLPTPKLEIENNIIETHDTPVYLVGLYIFINNFQPRIGE